MTYCLQCRKRAVGYATCSSCHTILSDFFRELFGVWEAKQVHAMVHEMDDLLVEFLPRDKDELC